MEPSSFPEANAILGPPRGSTEDDVGSLFVWRGLYDGKRVVLSCWRLSQEELEEVKRTGRVWVYLWGESMPPALVSGEHPMFPQAEAKQE